MRVPKILDLRAHPFELGEESSKYNDCFLDIHAGAGSPNVHVRQKGLKATAQDWGLEYHPINRRNSKSGRGDPICRVPVVPLDARLK